MKAKIILVAIAMICTASLFAQTTINLTQNDTKTFQLKNPSANTTTAQWNDNGGGYTNTGLTFTKTYATAGDFSLKVYPVSDKNCNGDEKSYTIHVVADVTALPEQIAISSIPDVCPLTTGFPTGGVATVNFTKTGFVPAGAWSISYKVGLAGTPQSVTVAAAATSFTFNATASAEVYIMGFTHGTSSTMYNDTNAPHAALVVNPAPTIDDIF
jgi:hypothetical protein